MIMKNGADIYDQQEIRQYVEAGYEDAAYIAARLNLPVECAQSYIDHFLGKEKPVVEVEDEFAMPQTKQAANKTKKIESLDDDTDGDYDTE